MRGLLSRFRVRGPSPGRSTFVPRGLTSRFRAQISDFLLPQRCIVCGGFGAALHVDCLDALPAAEGPRCVRCWRPGAGTWCERCATGGVGAPAFDALRAPFRFEGVARRALLEAKFRGVSAHLGPLGVAAARAVPPEWRVDAVVPVPLTGSRRRRRGYNQAEVLARHVAEGLGVGVRPRLLVRTRHAPPQATLSAEGRARNVAGVYAVRGVPPPGVLVVDDITTTGSTLSEVARILRAAGAERVYALAVARED